MGSVCISLISRSVLKDYLTCLCNVMASEADNCLFCHEVIHSAFCLIDDRDCENFMASEADSCLFVMT